jgi:probable O-glycosylation ligase (exosortase A-associated)
VNRVPIEAPAAGNRRKLPIAAAGGGFLYGWLLLAIFFEYARPASFIPGLAALPLNSAIPLGLLFVTMFAKSMRRPAEIWRDPATRWLCAYLLLIALSLLHSSVTLYAYRVFIAVLGYFFLFVMITRVVTTQARLFGVIKTLIAAHLFLIAMNPSAIMDPENRNYITGGSFLGDGNDFALSLCILLPLTIALIPGSHGNIGRLFLAAVVGVMILAIVATQSRGATIAMAVVLCYLFVRGRQKAIGVGALAVCVLVLAIYAPQQYFERMRTISSYSEDSSASARIEAWKAGAKMALDNPVLGVGSGNFPHHFPHYRGKDAPVRWMNAHSMYFQVLGELGLPGIYVLLMLMIGGFRMNQRCERLTVAASRGATAAGHVTLPLGYLNAMLIGLGIAGAFLSAAYYPHIFVVTGICVAQRAILNYGRAVES